jgi:hypothetical protein
MQGIFDAIATLTDIFCMAWMIMINGLIVDVRDLPRELQEAAFARGLIPYLPE